jgi:hypothetical protein
MAPCVTVLLPARELARIALENPNYALAQQHASATGESQAMSQSAFDRRRAFPRAAD